MTFNLSDAEARKAFVDKCFHEYGIDKNSVYLTEYGQFVIVDNLSPTLADRLSKESGVKEVFGDAPLFPF